MDVRRMGVKESEGAIAHLPFRDLAQLVSWLEDCRAQLWGKQA